MSLRVIIDGAGAFEIAKECTQKVIYRTDIPMSADARTKDVGSTLEISGKILAATDGDPADSTRQLDLWAVTPAENPACYRKVTVEIIAGGIVERKYHFPNAFVVSHKELYSDGTGNGTFQLIVKQKKDKMALITIDGGYPA